VSSERFSTFRRSAGIFAVMFSAVLAAASAAMAQAVKDVQQIKTLAALPILVVFGDHVKRPQESASGPPGSSPSKAVKHSSVASRRLAARPRCLTRLNAVSAATVT